MAFAVVFAVAGTAQSLAQSSETAPAPAPAPGAETPAAAGGVYKPPLRGAPGGRIGGASRSAALPAGSLPTIELLAPADHSGVTARPDPTLYFFISAPSRWPAQFTISAPMQPAPVLEVTIPSPGAAGFYPLPLSVYRARLQPGIVYTWSVSLVLDRRSWSHNLVASATMLFDPAQAANLAAARGGGAARLAEAGLWYDAVAAAVADQQQDRHAVLDSLMQQVGLSAAVAADRAASAR